MLLMSVLFFPYSILTGLFFPSKGRDEKKKNMNKLDQKMSKVIRDLLRIAGGMCTPHSECRFFSYILKPTDRNNESNRKMILIPYI